MLKGNKHDIIKGRQLRTMENHINYQLKPKKTNEVKRSKEQMWCLENSYKDENSIQLYQSHCKMD